MNHKGRLFESRLTEWLVFGEGLVVELESFLSDRPVRPEHNEDRVGGGSGGLGRSGRPTQLGEPTALRLLSTVVDVQRVARTTVVTII